MVGRKRLIVRAYVMRSKVEEGPREKRLFPLHVNFTMASYSLQICTEASLYQSIFRMWKPPPISLLTPFTSKFPSAKQERACSPSPAASPGRDCGCGMPSHPPPPPPSLLILAVIVERKKEDCIRRGIFLYPTSSGIPASSRQRYYQRDANREGCAVCCRGCVYVLACGNRDAEGRIVNMDCLHMITPRRLAYEHQHLPDTSGTV